MIKIPNEKKFRIVFNQGSTSIDTKIFSELLNEVLSSKYDEHLLRSITFRNLMEEVIGFEKTKLFVEFPL